MKASDTHPNAQLVAAHLQQAGATGVVRELAQSTRTAAEAAAALGCDIGAIVKSLVFMARRGEAEVPVLVLASGAHQVDLGLVAQHLGSLGLRRATVDEVREATGQPIGGVAPVGHPRQLVALIDSHLRGYEQIWAAAGTPHAVFPTTFEELARLTGAEEALVS
jgi:prolyl-tRNA editing enzyme YbaK/EbsC (Cys-tRNA(Pro) deacylase)